MTDGTDQRGELVYGEFECGGERVVRMEAIDQEEAWIRSSVVVPVEP